MKLVTYKSDGNEGIGSLEQDEIVLFGDDPSLPTDMLSFLEAGECAANNAIALCKNPKSKISLSDVELLAPISRPPKIIAIGLNYADHLEEVRAAGREMETPVVPMIFNKQSLSASGPYQDIHDPKVSEMLDFEGELTFVIGKKCRHVPKEKAHEVIAGYTLGLDMTVRGPEDRSARKSCDGYAVLGPWLVTADEIPDPDNVSFWGSVNGEIKQNANTSDQVLSIRELIEYASEYYTLYPGDVLYTGSPEGVSEVKAGDKLHFHCDQIGEFEIGIGT